LVVIRLFLSLCSWLVLVPDLRRLGAPFARGGPAGRRQFEAHDLQDGERRSEGDGLDVGRRDHAGVGGDDRLRRVGGDLVNVGDVPLLYDQAQRGRRNGGVAGNVTSPPRSLCS
jgi:hypothetical protein